MKSRADPAGGQSASGTVAHLAAAHSAGGAQGPLSKGQQGPVCSTPMHLLARP